MADNDDVAIRVDDLHKSFRLPHNQSKSVKGLFLNLFRANRTIERQQVLKGVSFEVKKGEFFGIVGRNGGGKSTLLKMLARIYEPDAGSIQINGNLMPFIELGVGFNPDLTGRENVYMNGALLGFSRTEMEKIYPKIVEFAELEKFMDQKLRNYSSGMQVRLAFSVAIQAHTDILLIDEVLAVGDANFQQKCYDVFEGFKKEGRTVVFISHSMQMVTRFCDRVILINEGKIVSEGEPSVVAAEYKMLNAEDQRENTDRLQIKNPREAHIADTVLANFTVHDELVELGSAGGRHVKLINSFGIKTYGVDANEKPTDTELKDTFYNKLEDIKTPQNIKGLLVLDNRKSISLEYLDSVFAELDGGRLKNVEKVYVHLPFHLFLQHMRAKDATASSHLGEPLDLSVVVDKLRERGFAVISSDMYGVDKPAQYVEAVLERFNGRKKVKLWDSSKA